MSPKKTSGTQTRRSKAERMRERLLEKLPDMLDAAIAAYQRIAETGETDDPKSFAAAQTGAKAALAHIDQIIKLAEATLEKEEGEKGVENDQVQALIQSARIAMASDRVEGEP